MYPIDPTLARWSSGYGPRVRHGREDLHTGADLLAPVGTPIYAVAPGVVRVSVEPRAITGYGRVIVLEHAPGYGFTLYGHLSQRNVTPGQRVPEGALIGLSGASGDRSELQFAPHLHFEWLTRWPPRARDFDRADPSIFLANFGYRGRAAPAISRVRPTAQPYRFTPEITPAELHFASAAEGWGLLLAAIARM
jgi:murein DD-endopeptidase MepM/ murein hydrolase activator NlpD